MVRIHAILAAALILTGLSACTGEVVVYTPEHIFSVHDYTHMPQAKHVVPVEAKGEIVAMITSDGLVRGTEMGMAIPTVRTYLEVSNHSQAGFVLYVRDAWLELPGGQRAACSLALEDGKRQVKVAAVPPRSRLRLQLHFELPAQEHPHRLREFTLHQPATVGQGGEYEIVSRFRR